MTRCLLRWTLFGAITAVCYHNHFDGRLIARGQGATAPHTTGRLPLPPVATSQRSESRTAADDGTLRADALPDGTWGYDDSPNSLWFYNYYAAPGAGGKAADMYPAPRPTPPLVGHVYFTYPPLLPHEYLYTHHREYFTYYGHYHGYGACDGPGSVNHTVVRYQRGTIRPTYFQRFHPPPVPAIPCGSYGGYGCP